MKTMNALIGVMLLAGCASQPIKVSDLLAPKACVVNAVQAHDAYLRLHPYRWTKVLVIKRPDAIGHAVCVFEFKGRIMQYDADFGSSTLTRDLTAKDEPDKLAELWSDGRPFSEGYFLEDSM